MLHARKCVYIGRATVEFLFKNHVGAKAQLGEVWRGAANILLALKNNLINYMYLY